MRRQFRLVTTAFLLAASLIAIQKAPRAAAFTWPDYCGTTYACATWTFNFTGAGSAHGYDDQGGLDCYYNGSQPSGTCTYLYYWIAQMYPNGQLPVTRTVAPSANSYLCGFDGSSCKEPGSSSTATLDLSANEIVTSDFQVNLAKVQTTTVAKNSDGSGKIISSPSGLNCTVTSGVNSGTCTATFYFRDSLTVTYTATPVSDSLACVNSITNCAAVGEPNHSAVTYTFSGTGGTLLFFLQAHPILTVGVTGQGTVVSSPSGISCPSTCHKYFAPDTNVTLNAAAKSGYMFSGWTGACNGYGSTCNLSLGSTDVGTTAVFSSPATPTPTTLPHPTATPKPGSTPAPTSRPAATTIPQGSGSPNASTGAEAPTTSAAATPIVERSADPFATVDPAASTQAPNSASSTARPLTADGGPVASSSPRAATHEASGDGINLILLLVALLIAVGALALGVALGRRGRREASS